MKMIHNSTQAEGQMLRMERLRQGKELKEVVGKICSISTLSKIERGKQKVDPDMLAGLYNELGIKYEKDTQFIEKMSHYIKQYFYETLYQFEKEALIILENENARLQYSPLALDWMIIKAMEYEDREAINILDYCVDFMNQEQLAWYYLIERYEDKDITLEKRIKAQRILQNSYATLNLMWTYWSKGEYSIINNLSNIAVNFALDEGNTWALSQVYLILGGIYSVYNMEEAMLLEYQKSMRLLKNTNWTKELDVMYYNIGATYLTLGNYEKAREYLEKADKDNFGSYHKWAVLENKEGHKEEANEWVSEMDRCAKEYKEKNHSEEDWDNFKKLYYDEMIALLKVTKLQIEGNPEKSSDYIPLLESLMDKFLKDGRYGFMNFHKEYLKEAYIKNRRYKDALELEGLFSKMKTKYIIKI